MDATAPSAAWYPDPDQPGMLRWWDGAGWTDHVHAVEVPVPGTTGPAQVLAPVPDVEAPLFEREPAGDDESARERWVRLLAEGWTLERALAQGGIVALGLMLLHYSGSRYIDWMTGVGDVPSKGDAKLTVMLFVLGAFLFSWPVHRAWRTARAAFRLDWSNARGLREATDAELVDLHELATARLPVFQLGDSRRISHVSVGTLRGMSARIGELAIVTSNSSSMTGPAPSTSRRYWFAAFELPAAAAARYPGTSVRERAGGRRTGGKDLGERLSLESIELDERVRIAADPATDPVALRELFGPQLIVRLVDARVSWDQRHDLLFVYASPDEAKGSDLDRFCAAAADVAHAFWREQR